jgi:hypothetical protein
VAPSITQLAARPAGPITLARGRTLEADGQRLPPSQAQSVRLPFGGAPQPTCPARQAGPCSEDIGELTTQTVVCSGEGQTIPWSFVAPRTNALLNPSRYHQPCAYIAYRKLCDSQVQIAYTLLQIWSASWIEKKYSNGFKSGETTRARWFEPLGQLSQALALG